MLSTRLLDMIMDKDELEKTDKIKDYVELVIGCLEGNPDSIRELSMESLKDIYTYYQQRHFRKLCKFIKGQQAIEKELSDLGKKVRFCDKLFGDPKKSRENAIRTIEAVDKIDEEKKFEYFNNTTREFLLNDKFGVADLFRFYKAITNTLSEDLDYLSLIIEQVGVEGIRGNTQVLALADNGLMILGGADGNESPERQIYFITELGYKLDEYVLSRTNDERQKWYKEGNADFSRNFATAVFESIDNIDDLVRKASKDTKEG